MAFPDADVMKGWSREAMLLEGDVDDPAWEALAAVLGNGSQVYALRSLRPLTRSSERPVWVRGQTTGLL